MDAPLTIPGNHCVIHGYHWPRPSRTVNHHIWPLEFGGPTVAANLVLVCDTGHYNIHAYLDFLLGRSKVEPTVHRLEKRLAQRGLVGIQERRIA